MNLKDKLMEYDESTPLKIGAVDGTRFFYCGSVGEFLENIERYANVGRDAYTKCVERYIIELHELIKEQPPLPDECYWARDAKLSDVVNAIAECAIATSRTHDKAKLLRWVSAFGTWTYKTAAAANKLKAVKNLYDVWIPYADRYVASVWEVDTVADPAGGIAVTVEGYETGAYWIHEEAKGKKRFKIMSVTKGVSSFGLDMGDDKEQEDDDE